MRIWLRAAVSTRDSRRRNTRYSHASTLSSIEILNATVTRARCGPSARADLSGSNSPVGSLVRPTRQQQHRSLRLSQLSLSESEPSQHFSTATLLGANACETCPPAPKGVFSPPPPASPPPLNARLLRRSNYRPDHKGNLSGHTGLTRRRAADDASRASACRCGYAPALPRGRTPLVPRVPAFPFAETASLNSFGGGTRPA